MCWTHLTKYCVLLILVFRALAKTVPGYGSVGERCDMGEGVIGTCEEVSACLRDGGVVQRPEKVTPNTVQGSHQVKLCQSQEGQIYVCCRKPHLIAEELCEAWSHLWRDRDGKCAINHPLIIGGTTANVGEFPHVALLGLRYRSDPIGYNCGGTLISPHFVLTAAHCLVNYREGVTYWVKLGEHDREHDATNTLIDRLKGSMPSSLYHAQELINDASVNAPVEQVIEVERQFIYPSYNLFKHYHDVALLRLKTPAKLSKRVLPACLPYQYPEIDYVGERLTVIGWGHTSRVRELSKTLQKVKVPVVDRLMCSETRANSFKTPKGITEDMICAGELGKDSCSGDSGGPLTLQTPRSGTSCEHTVVGVVSFGIGTNHNPCGFLGVYGRVSSYLDWITGHIAPNGTDYRSGSSKH